MSIGSGARRSAIVAIGLVAIVTAFACTAAAPTAGGTTDGKLTVVVAERFWASIATQLGGDRVHVTSIISSPDTDPHDYEPTPADARAIASAQYVVFNGVGYDPWVRQSLDANEASGRRVFEIGARLGLAADDNPHRWYFPHDVAWVIDQITADYKALAPVDADYFEQQRVAFTTAGLKRYTDLIADIARRYRGTAVGASESIFVGIAQATGLELATPNGFLNAISEGTEPSAPDKAEVDRQIASRSIRVFVYNRQNATPDVLALVHEAQRAGVETVTITETPPEEVSFEEWQAQQLQELADALARADGA